MECVCVNPKAVYRSILAIEGFEKVVEISFSKEEWGFLMRHPDFVRLMERGCKTLDDVERICGIGECVVGVRKQPKPPLERL